ncbi:MAG: histidine ammonia-lyase [marine benthic group bacterium]|jgi:histidine ammonia-lyase|nr:histidine ammonia-lyase [Candidatus Benthicola marisminoris]
MISVTGSDLSIEEVVAVARRGEKVAPLDAPVRERMSRSCEWIEKAVAAGDRAIYGVNTGFGPLASTRIRPEEAARLSRNLILNCCAGVGPPLAEDVVRAMMVIRANTLARGNSGVRPELADSFIRMLNKGVRPYVPSKGSLGASGDLAPLAHIGLVITRDPDGDGEDTGKAWFEGELLTGAEAMERAGIPRLVPRAKEGLSLTNGTTFMVAAAALAVRDALDLLDHAEAAAALAMEALRARSNFLHPALHEASGQKGQPEAAWNLRRLLDGSRLLDSDPDRVQDAYSLRCIPQVHGPIRDAVRFVMGRVDSLLNGTSDNPLVFMDLPDGAPPDVVSGGNFHGQGVALWLDLLGIAAAEVGGMSERRTFRLLTPDLSEGLPSMLVAQPGLDSGLMVMQYTAAALVSDNKTLAHPDSVDSIPSSANQEDHVSMGANAARHTMEILENLRHILAIELLTGAQAIDLREAGADGLAPLTRTVHEKIRSRVKFLEHDRVLTPDIEAVVDLVRSNALLADLREH